MIQINQFTQILTYLDNLANSDLIKGKIFDDFTVTDLEKMKSDDIRYLYKKN